MVFVKNRYYTERNGPDPNMTPYYQSVPMAMWVTLLNLSGEAPLCDYTVWGKVGPFILMIFFCNSCTLFVA